MEYNIFACGDHAVTVEFSNVISMPAHMRVMALYRQLQQAEIAGVKDIIPCYTSLTVVYDIAVIKKYISSTAYEYMSQLIEQLATQDFVENEMPSRLIKVPVCYDMSMAPGLQRIADEKRLEAAEITYIHSAQTYRVYMLGFLPGFAYMGVVDERIATPRLSTPALQVAAGSVGIAGNQTGIYPLDSPGGWNIIGRTPLQLFDATKEKPCFFQPGDTVQFFPVSLEEYNHLKQLA